MVICLENVLEYEQPTKYIVKSENYSDDFALPVLTAGKSFVLGFTDETDGICKASESPVIIFDDFTADCKYVDFDFKVKSSAMKILHKANTEDNLKYYFYAMQAIDYTPFSHKRVWISEYSKFKIKNRSIAEQNNIVKELDTVATAIDNAKQRLNALDELVKSRFIEMFGDPVENPLGWKKVALSDVAEIKIGPFGSLLHKEDYIENGHPLVNPSHIIDGSISTDSKLSISDVKYAELNSYHLKVGDVVLGRRGEMGRCAVVKTDSLLCGTGSLIIRANEDVTSEFIQNIISFPSYKEYIEGMAIGQTMRNLNVPIVSNLQIIKPPLDVQKQYYDFVKLIDKSKFIVQKQIDDLQELLDSKMDEYFG